MVTHTEVFTPAYFKFEFGYTEEVYRRVTLFCDDVQANTLTAPENKRFVLPGEKPARVIDLWRFETVCDSPTDGTKPKPVKIILFLPMFVELEYREPIDFGREGPIEDPQVQSSKYIIGFEKIEAMLRAIQVMPPVSAETVSGRGVVKPAENNVFQLTTATKAS